MMGLVEPSQNPRAKLEGNQPQRVLVHGAFVPDAGICLPREGKQHPLIGARVLFQAFLQEAGDRALGAADRPVQKKHAAFGAVTLGRRLEGVDQVHQRPIQAVNGVAMLGGEFREELEARDFFLVFENILGAMRQDHVI